MNFFDRLFRRRKPAEAQPAAMEEAAEAQPATTEEAAVSPASAPASEEPPHPLEQEAAAPPDPLVAAEDTAEKQAPEKKNEAGSNTP